MLHDGAESLQKSKLLRVFELSSRYGMQFLNYTNLNWILIFGTKMPELEQPTYSTSIDFVSLGFNRRDIEEHF